MNLGFEFVDKGFGNVKKVADGMNKAMCDAMDKLVEIGIKQVRTEYINSGLHRRSNVLWNSFNEGWGSKVQGKGTTRLRGIIGTDIFYSVVHEWGKVISPGAKGFLAWPNPQAQVLAGTRFRKGQEGDYIFTRKPVTIPPRPFVRPASDKLRPRVKKVFGERMEILIQRAK